MSFPCPKGSPAHRLLWATLIPPPRLPVDPQAPYQKVALQLQRLEESSRPGSRLSRVQVIAPWRMPGFYNRPPRAPRSMGTRSKAGLCHHPGPPSTAPQACPSRGLRLGLVPVPGDQTLSPGALPQHLFPGPAQN